MMNQLKVTSAAQIDGYAKLRFDMEVQAHNVVNSKGDAIDRDITALRRQFTSTSSLPAPSGWSLAADATDAWEVQWRVLQVELDILHANIAAVSKSQAASAIKPGFGIISRDAHIQLRQRRRRHIVWIIVVGLQFRHWPGRIQAGSGGAIQTARYRSHDTRGAGGGTSAAARGEG